MSTQKAMGTQKTSAQKELRVDPIACVGHGACAELLPEMISLDEWGYPLLDPRPVPPGLERQARRAVSGCPVLALRLTPLA
jgi:ferredoxin